jgi:hypothetical protein
VTSPPRRACSYEATRGPGLMGAAAGRRTGRPVEVKALQATIKSGQTGLRTHREHRGRILTAIKCGLSRSLGEEKLTRFQAPGSAPARNALDGHCNYLTAV